MIARSPSELENLASDTGTDMFRTAENLAEAAVPELGDIVTVELLELTLRGEVPPPGALCGSTPLRRAAFRSLRGASGARPAYAVGDMIPNPPTTPYRQTLAHLRPRLIRELNDDSLWLARDSARARVMREARVRSLVVVPLVVQGAVLGLVALCRQADSAPYDAGDLQAAATFAERAALCIDLVRRRIQERARARLLQRALLPEALPSLSALEAARSHVPVEGSGGEWFDIIPLSGARVALVVGATEGEGADGHEPAVLVTRTRALDTDNVATRSLPPHAAAVAAARRWTGRQLARWMLNELAYPTALIVSELVTNAIRYSTGPVELRLINDDRTLICEVSDTSSTAPHLREPERCDESGRGLFIVAQLAQHQGTRYTASGKTVWTEQDLPT
ncbi:ATP-binding protein [Streptomyces sp. NPDC003328]